MIKRRKDRVDPRVMVASLGAFLLFWALLSALKGDSSILPSPIAVWQALIDQLLAGKLLYHVWMTLLRVIAAFSISMVIGTALGMALGTWPRFNRWADPWVVVFLNLPALGRDRALLSLDRPE